MFRKLRLEPLEDRRLLVVVPGLPADYEVARGGVFDGVAKILSTNNDECTGSLLMSGRHVLTAAHCFSLTVSFDTTVTFELADFTGDRVPDDLTYTVPESSITQHPTILSLASAGYPDGGLGYDVAIIDLGEEVPDQGPMAVPRYDLWRGDLSTITGQVIELVGYGKSGDGICGRLRVDTVGDGNISDCSEELTSLDFGVKRKGENRIQSTVEPVNRLLLSNDANKVRPRYPNAAGQLLFDFDNSLTSNPEVNDYFLSNFGVSDPDGSTGRGAMEVGLEGGDSGGPVFLNDPTQGRVIVGTVRGGVAKIDNDQVDFSPTGNSTFGEAFMLTSTTSVDGWIDTFLDPYLPVGQRRAPHVEFVKVRHSQDIFPGFPIPNHLNHVVKSGYDHFDPAGGAASQLDSIPIGQADIIDVVFSEDVLIDTSTTDEISLTRLC